MTNGLRRCIKCKDWVHEENFYEDRTTCNFCLGKNQLERRKRPKLSDISTLLSNWTRPTE